MSDDVFFGKMGVFFSIHDVDEDGCSTRNAAARVVVVVVLVVTTAAAAEIIIIQAAGNKNHYDTGCMLR
jgi:cobyrinic acid a,c-diamide synthase